MNNLPETFPQCLVRLRELRGKTQKILAIDAGMDQSYLAGLESGRRPPPRDRQIQRLLVALAATEEDAIQLFTAKAVTKLNSLLSKSAPEETMPLASLLASVAGMSIRDVITLRQIADVLRSANLHPGDGRLT